MTLEFPKRGLVCFFWLAALFTADAAEWQWSLAITNSLENPGAARAWLWIPAHCQQVRGVVVAQYNMEEISIVENPKFRAALAQLNFAEIWVAPPFDHLFRFNQGAGETFNSMMDGLAEESGYAELKFVPVAPMGHSAAASWPYYFAAWNPGRTLAALSVSGQWPWFRDKSFAPDIWGDRNIDFVPSLESMGEYESANDWSREGLLERQAHPKMPLSMLANPGQGHFASTDAKVEYLALYLKKAVQYRVPKNWDATAAPELIPIDPAKTGRLADKWRLNQPATAPAAPGGEYKGDAKEAFWFFDEELAAATEKYEAAWRGSPDKRCVEVELRMEQKFEAGEIKVPLATLVRIRAALDCYWEELLRQMIRNAATQTPHGLDLHLKRRSLLNFILALQVSISGSVLASE